MKGRILYVPMMVTLIGGLLAVPAATPLLAAEFSADLVRADEYGDEETARVYVKGELRREEIMDEGEVEGWVIFRPDKGVLWNVSPDDEMYVEVPLNIGGNDVLEQVNRLEGSTTRKSLGMEKLNGFDCEKTQYQYQEGGQGGVLVWYSKALDYPIRIIQQDLAGKAMQTVEIKNVDQGPVPTSKFEIPGGYEKMTMPAMPEMPEGMPEGMIPDFPDMGEGGD